MARVTAVIPAQNEEKTVGDVVEAARAAQLIDDIVVVDSLSKDRTAEVARSHGASFRLFVPSYKRDRLL